MEYSSWSWVYFVSFVLIGTFVVLNVVIAIIVNSMDEVRAMELERERTELVAAALSEGEADERMQERLQRCGRRSTSSSRRSSTTKERARANGPFGVSGLRDARS